MSEEPVGQQPSQDVYTVLLIVATVMVFAATIYLAIRSNQLFGSWNPFSSLGA